MTELKEVFEMVTKQTEPDLDAWKEQEKLQRRVARNRRIGAFALAAGLVVAATFVAMGSIPGDTGGPGPGTTGPTGPSVVPHPTGVGLQGLPPKRATPSTPERGKLVLGIGFGHTDGDPERYSLQMYADGRVIWQRLGNREGTVEDTGLIEQRLTPEGVELVLAEALSTGLFDHDRDFAAADGLYYGGIEVRDGDRFARIAWGNAGFEVGGPATTTTPTPEQVRTIKRLDARLEDLSSWLPASAWEDQEFRAYVPSRYTVCYMDLAGSGSLGQLGILDLLPRSAEDLLRTLDTTQSYPNGFRGSDPFWCSIVSTEQARKLIAVLEGAGASRQGTDLSYAYWEASPGTGVDIGLEPSLPHDSSGRW